MTDSTEGGLKYRVECAWCGIIIRRTNSKNSRGMCLKCYARMLGEHGVMADSNRVAPHASDR
ncbi:MAG TPA: hypothetical protein VK619_03245 [Pyrinomonadaceae bacterium]|nr:hypothetical protein [Pyrinomonadaceae bacterium]